MIPHVRFARMLGKCGLLVLVAACSPMPTSIPVTLTAPVPTQTAKPVELVPSMQLGASYTYADGAALVAVPSGEFVMGHGTADDPEHELILSDFWIYATEVTNYQYSLCVDQGWCTPPDAADNPLFGAHQEQHRPVVGVDHAQAVAYCRYMGGDLPTEAQWEKAARSSDGRPYPWGDAEPSCQLANSGDCLGETLPVYLAPEGRSPYGALHMAGNVYEWVADWYDPLYYESSPVGDPQGPADGRARVIRSSGYRSSAIQSLAYARSYSPPGDHRPDLGFRCTVGDPAFFAPACSLAPAVSADQMAAVAVECPKLSIDVQTTACRYGGGAVVTFNNDHPQDANASFGGIVGCTLDSGYPGSYPLRYQCRRASTAVMSSRCTYSDVPEGTCPPNYRLDTGSGLCLWDASRSVGIDCPAGEFHDPVAHCCRITSGNPADFGVCAVGSTFTEIGPGRFSCLPAEKVREPPEVTQAINPPVCEGLCELSVELCGARNLEFCPTLCSCLAVGRKCPER